MIEFPSPMVMPFKVLEWVPSIKVEASEFFGICLKVTVQGADPPESKVLAIWSFGEDTLGVG